jgi:hypothetical protein
MVNAEPPAWNLLHLVVMQTAAAKRKATAATGGSMSRPVTRDAHA